MCGIAGVVTWQSPEVGDSEHRRVRTMCDAIRHRGPDSSGLERVGNAMLGHRRLSVIDLSAAGRQPMANETGTVWVTYNGEIYNFQSIREELIGHGHSFQSRTDTEVIVHGFEQWGMPELVRRLRGMFAFAVFDRSRSEVWLARDRLGVKPLYYVSRDGECAFCSEPAPLMNDGAPPGSGISGVGLDFYFNFGYLPPDTCMVERIRKVAPGQILRIDSSGCEAIRYWKLPLPGPESSYSQVVDRVETQLMDAVEARLVSDVPLGTFLSGGIDSGLVSAMAAKALPDPLAAFTVTFAGGANSMDELELAESAASRYRLNHREVRVQPSRWELLPRLIAIAGEPFADSSLIPTALICREARRNVTVALTGDGGDDLFAGYNRVMCAHLGGGLRSAFGRSVLAGALRCSELRDSGRLRRISTVLRYGIADFDRMYGVLNGVFDAGERAALFEGTFRHSVGTAGEYIHNRASGFEGLSDAEKFLRVDFETRLPGRYLTKVDVASNAFSLECRSPLLDHRLAEFSGTIPVGLKLRGFRQKAILRSLGKRYLSPKATRARKMGFATSLRDTFARLGSRLDATLGGFGCCADGILRKSEMDRYWSEHAGGARDHSERLWTLVCFEIWWRIFARNEDVNELGEKLKTMDEL